VEQISPISGSDPGVNFVVNLLKVGAQESHVVLAEHTSQLGMHYVH